MPTPNTLKVLSLQQFTAEPEFYANTISSHLKTSHLHINRPHKHDFFSTFLFTRGSGRHEIDFNTYEVKPGMVFLLSPGQTHYWELSDDAEGFIFFHSQEFYETHYLHELLADYPFFSTVQNQAAVFLDKKELAEISRLFQKVILKRSSNQPKTKSLLLSLITQIYIELENAAAKENAFIASEHDGYYLKFLQFRQLLEVHFAEEKSATKYADWMHITPKHLNRINKSIVNKTTSEIISDRVILEAKRILVHGKKNFTEVADGLGFDDYAHFSKLFKKKTQLTPTAFIKNYQ